jgi:acyl-CoA synthetase (AMP-forming)/AMP-acid ligase II
LVGASREHGTRLATIYGDERISFEGQYRASLALAAALHERGVGPGDRVALCASNAPEWPVAFFAITSLGAIAVLLNAWWTTAELVYGLNDSGAICLIVDAKRWEKLAGERAEFAAVRSVLATRGESSANVESLERLIGRPSAWDELDEARSPDHPLAPDDDATLFYTSGTTALPKAAIGTHRNLMTNILSLAYVAARTVRRRGEPLPAPSPRIGLIITPLFHVTACSGSLMGATAAGHTTIYMQKWDALEAMAIIEREKVQATGGVPTIAWQLLEHPERARFDLSSLDSIGYGGAPAAPELVRRIRDEFGAMPANGWGMTETMATVTSHAAEDYLNRPDSCGPPVPVADLRIMADDGVSELAIGEVGELWAKGPQVVRGYWNRPQETAQTFRDGWVRTGDLARLDDEGFCYIVDRVRDMIIRSGENIYSSEVESALYSHPRVDDAALIGLPDRTQGELPVAVVHLNAGPPVDPKELQAWVFDRLGQFKTPVRIEFSDDLLPRNANGKILKKDLAAFFI